MTVEIRPAAQSNGDQIILDGQSGEFPLFYLEGPGAELRVSSVEIKNFARGAIIAEGGAVVTLNDVNLTRNSAMRTVGSRRRALAAADFETCGGAIRLVNGATASLSASVLTENSAERGGAVCVLNGSTLTIDSSRFTRNSASAAGGAALVADASALTVRNASAFEDNNSTLGGALAVGASSSLVLKEFALHANTASDGGALWTNGHVSLTNGNFSANQALQTGGGLCAAQASSTSVVHNVVFTANTAKDGAGASVVDGGTADFRSVVWSGNTARLAGGGLRVANYSVVAVDEASSLRHNHAAKGGGAAVVQSSVLEALSGVNVTENHGLSLGGALWIDANSTVLAGEGSRFAKNVAGSGGGLAVTNGSSARCTGSCQVEHNAAFESDGGGVLLDTGSHFFVAGDVRLAGNSANATGGGLAAKAEARFEASGEAVASSNRAGAGAGVALATGSVSTFSRLVLRDNRAVTVGGGLLLEAASQLSVDWAAASSNEASTSCGGGIAVLSSSTFSSTSSTYVNENQAACGAGIYAEGAALVALNGETIVATNYAQYDGGGAALSTSASLNVSGTATFTGNRALGGAGASITDASVMSFRGPLVEFSSNVAGLGGGGVAVVASLMVSQAENTTLTNNTALVGGGGLASDEATLQVLGDLTVTMNVATSHGGGLAVLNGSSAAVSHDAHFLENTATGGNGGGLLVANKSDVGIENTLIAESCVAGSSGGGLAVSASSTLAAKHGSFLYDAAEMNGGGVYVEDGAQVAFSEFTHVDSCTSSASGGGVALTSSATLNTPLLRAQGNVAGLRGGGMYSSSSATVSALAIELVENQAASGGAAYAAEYSSVSCQSLLAERNSATLDGGGAALTTSAALVVSMNGSFISNTAGSDGGGLVIESAGAIHYANGALLTAVHNRAGARGGGIAASGSGSLLELHNVTLVGNEADKGGAVALSSNASCQMSEHAVAFGNGAVSSGGGLHLESGATAEVRDQASLRTNVAAYGGCASVTSGASLAIRDDVELTACNASLGGGGLYVDDALFTALGAARIDQCVAPSGGGAYATGSSAVIELSGASRVVNSTAALDASDSTRSGGGVHATSDSRVLIASSAAVLQNHAAYGAGLSLVDGGSARVLGTIESNRADYGAGVCALSGGSLVLDGDAVVRENRAVADGAGVYASASSIVLRERSSISSNTGTTEASYAGGVYAEEGSSVKLFNTSSVDYNKAGYGSGLYIDSDSTLLLDGAVSVSHNRATGGAGGVKAINGAVIDVRGATLSGNTAESGSGGAFELRFEAVLSVQGMTANNNYASQSGGVVYVAGTATVSGFSAAVCVGNYALRGGMCVMRAALSLPLSSFDAARVPFVRAYVENAGELSTSKSQMINNRASYGGVVYVDADARYQSVGDTNVGSESIDGGGAVIHGALYSTVLISGCAYQNNTASGLGGGLYIEFPRRFDAVDSVFEGNLGTDGGGAVYFVGDSTATILNCTFSKNRATATSATGVVTQVNGGGLLIVPFSSTTGSLSVGISNSTFMGNSVSGSGAGVYVQSSTGTGPTLTVQGGAFQANTADVNGGGFHITSTTTIVRFADFSRNVASNGAGVFASATALSVSHTSMKLNTATESGGALYMDDDASVLLCNQSSLVGNVASDGGAFALLQAEAFVSGTRFVRNEANGDQAKGGAATLRDGVKWIRPSWSGLMPNRFTANSAGNAAGDTGWGGALYLSNSSYVVRGGATGPNGVANGTRRALSESNASDAYGDYFGENIATSAGGALFWNFDDMSAGSVASFWNATRVNNTVGNSGWGNDAATSANKIEIAYSGVMEASGILFDAASPVTAEAFDVYDQVTTALVATVTISCDTAVDNEEPVVDEAPDLVTCESAGELTSDLVDGKTEMSDFYVTLRPGKTVALGATLSYLTPEDRTATLTASVGVWLRECNRGETKIIDDSSGRITCEYCDNYNTEFSFDPTANADCKKCPTSVESSNAESNTCHGDIIQLKRGFWRHEPLSTTIRKCFSEYWCLAGNRTGDAQCREGHYGPMCGVCEVGYTMNDYVGLCVACEEGDAAEAKMILGICFAGAMMLIGLVVYSRRRIMAFIHEKVPFLEDWHKHITEFRVKAKILLVFFQIVSQYCGGCLNPPWPPLYQQIARKFELVNLNFVSVAAATCSVKPNYGWKLVGMTAGPIMLSMLILLYYVANRIRIAVLIKQEEAGGATTGIGGGPPTVDAQNLEISADAEEEPVGTANQAGADGETQSVPDEIPSNTIFRVDLLPIFCVGLLEEVSAKPALEAVDGAPGPPGAETGGDDAALNTEEGTDATLAVELGAEEEARPEMHRSASRRRRSSAPLTPSQRVLHELKDRCTAAFFLLTYLIFPGTSLVVFRSLSFSCDYKMSSVDKELGYLKADMAIDCTSEDYKLMESYAYLMMVFFPIGIPLMYLYLTHQNRAFINPDPLAVLADILRVSTVNLKRSTEERVPISDDMKMLAHNVLIVRARQMSLVESTTALHEKMLSEQTMRDEEEDRAFHERALSENFSTAKRISLLADVKLERDWRTNDARVAPTWQDAFPGTASVNDDLESACALMEASMVVTYRAADPQVKHLAFLFEAYEPRCWYWESLECIRRLALTGLLIFFSDGTVMQIIVASLIAMVALILYDAFEPYLDDSADRLATFAQLMTFLTLFAAILLTTGAIQPFVGETAISYVMVSLNLAVLVYSGVELALGKLSCSEACDHVEEIVEATAEEAEDMFSRALDRMHVHPKHFEALLVALNRKKEQQERGRNAEEVDLEATIERDLVAAEDVVISEEDQILRF